MKNKKIIINLIILLSVLVVFLVGFMFYFMNGNHRLYHFNWMHKVSNELIMDEVYHTNFKKVELISDASDIFIKRSNDDTVRVVVYGDKDRLNVNTDNEKLFIKSEAKNCEFFCINITVAKIEVYLPENYENEIEIKNKYGDIEIDKFMNARIEIQEDCGDVKIEEAKEVVVKNSYGDIKIGTIEKADIEESAGDVTVEKVENITVKNNYGDIHIKEVSSYLDVSDDCGNIKIDQANIDKDSVITNNLGDIKIGSTNEIYIDAKTDLGDVKIDRNYHKSDITLKIENDCGDIKVNNK